MDCFVMDITQRTLASSELVGFDFGVDNWIFADQFFKPSYWLILKRESFSQFSHNPLEAIDILMYRLDTHQLIQIYHLSGVYETDIGFWDTLHIRSRVESLIMSGYIQVFNVGDAIADRMANADDPIYSNPQNYASTGNPISDKRNELAESFGYDITERWLGKVAADQLHFDRWQLWQNIIEAYDSGMTFADTVWDLLVGLKDIAVFAVSVVGNELEFQFKVNSAALKAAGNTLTGDQAAARQALNEWGIVIGDRIKSQQEFVDTVSKKAKQGYEMLIMLYNDGLTRTLLFDYFDSLYKSMPYRKQQTIGDRIFFEIGIEVLLAIATGGLINAARRGGQLAANTTRAARATTATKRIGPLTVEAIDHLSDLAKMLDKPTLKTEEPLIKVYPEDLPKKKPNSDQQLNSGDRSKNNRREKPSAEEVELAKSEGTTPKHIAAREKVSRDYLTNNGFKPYQIDNALGNTDKGINGGFDLSKPVEIVKFPPPDTMTQYTKGDGKPGNWFDPFSNQTADSLGISSEGRTLSSFKMPEGSGIQSYAKPVTDVWTNPDNPVVTQGGGVQLFVNNTIKQSSLGL